MKYIKATWSLIVKFITIIAKYLVGIAPLIFMLLLGGGIGYIIICMWNYGTNFSTSEISNLEKGKSGLIIFFFCIFFIILLKYFKNILLGVFSLLSLIFKGKTALNKQKRKLIQQYFSFIKKYTKQRSVKNISKSYFFLLSYIFKTNLTIPHKDLAKFYAPFEHKEQIQEFNQLCMNHIGKENYIKNIELGEQYFLCSINKGGLTSQKLAKKIEEQRDEITRFFTKNNFQANILVELRGLNEVMLKVYDEQELWKTQNLDFDSLKLKKGELLCGFYPTVKKKVIQKEYITNINRLISSMVIGTSGSGKDLVMSNIILSILYNVKYFKNYELYALDTKNSDFHYLENLKSYGIFRYSDIENYNNYLEELIKIMKSTQDKISGYSNVNEYNSNSGKTPIPTRIIVINELLALGDELKNIEIRAKGNGKNIKLLEPFLANLNTLLAKSRSVNFKIFILTQSIRRDGGVNLGTFLANIQDRFILRGANIEEININARGLSGSEKERVTYLRKYNCLHISNNKISQEFKAFFMKQSHILNWIHKNFEQKKEFENEKINDYLQYARKNNDISKNLAMQEFGLSIANWEELIKYLETHNEIERLPNNKIVFTKK